MPSFDEKIFKEAPFMQKCPKLKVAIYCRLSEEDKNKHSESEDSVSIQNQKAMLTKYASLQGWEIYRIYSDDDYTGSDRRRPEFNELLKDAEAQKFDIVLCKTQSRFTRELELVEKYIHGLFPVWGIRFISIVDNADTANKGNKKSRQINGLVNEWYLEDMSENIRSVLKSRRENGLHIGSFALYGYKKDPNQKGHLIIDEDAASIVREVFNLFSKGYGKTAIARMLNNRNIPNPTEYKRLKGLRYKQPKSKNSTLWKYFTISNMLTNEIYIGNMVQGKYGSVSYKTKQNKPRPKSQWYIVENTHEPIIDRELWDRVQKMIKEHSKPFDTGNIGLFSRKVRCMNCAYSMRSTKSRGKHYLLCPSHHISKDACIGSFISVEKLEQTVVDELNKMSKIYLNRAFLEENIELCPTLQAQKDNLLENISSHEKRTSELSKAIRELYIDKSKGLISATDYLEIFSDFTGERSRLENLISYTREQILEIDNKMQADDSRHEIVEQFINLKHLNREIVEILIDYISVGKRIPKTNDVPIEIHWNF